MLRKNRINSMEAEKSELITLSAEELKKLAETTRQRIEKAQSIEENARITRLTETGKLMLIQEVLGGGLNVKRG